METMVLLNAGHPLAAQSTCEGLNATPRGQDEARHDEGLKVGHTAA
jgi:hypothetical protein